MTNSFHNGKIGYLNPANGKTLQAVLAGPVVTIDNGDGTSTVCIPGNDQRYTAPGMGLHRRQHRAVDRDDRHGDR